MLEVVGNSQPPNDPVRVLLVDDNPTNLQVLYQTLEGGDYELLIARSGEEAIKVAGNAAPALILLDIMMPPGIDGFETCRRLKSDRATSESSIIFMSALDEASDKVKGLELGAVDYITKPFNDHEVQARVNTHLQIRQLERDLLASNQALHEINRDLEARVAERSKEVLRSRDAIIFGLAKLAESRDDDTGQHLERVCRYVEILATHLADSVHEIDEHWIKTITITAALHDIGKVGIPDAVLNKPGKLTDDERAIMQKHTTIGGDTLLAIKQRWGDDTFLTTATQIAFGHHERWDGKGYPFGLDGDTIALEARMVSVADVYDALTSTRVYKPPFSHEEAKRIIVEGSGTQFDPMIVDAFLATEDAFRRTGEELQG